MVFKGDILVLDLYTTEDVFIINRVFFGHKSLFLKLGNKFLFKMEFIRL